MGSTLLFTTESDNESGVDNELWAFSPGETSATLIKDFEGDDVSTVGVAGSTLYLSVGGNLWSTGGTAQTTQELEDSSSKPIPAPSDLFGFGGQVYYLSTGASSTTIGIVARPVRRRP